MNRIQLACGVVALFSFCGACSDAESPNPASGGSAPGGSASGGAPAAGAPGGGAGAMGGTAVAGSGGSGGQGSAAGNGGGGAGGASGGAAGGAGGTAGASGGTGGASGGAGGAIGGTGGSGGGAGCITSPGKAIRLDGNKIDILSANLGAELPGGNTNRTVELWAKFTGASSWTAERSVIETGKHVTANNQILGIDMSGRASSTQGRFGPYTNGFSDNNGAQGVPFDAAPDVGWLHLAWSFDTVTGLSFTINGVQKPVQMGGQKLTLDLTPGILTLGLSQNFGDPQGWDGVMDEVKIWSVSKTPAEVLAGMRVVPSATTPGLVAYYRFNEGTGSTVADEAKKPTHTLGPCSAKNDICPAVNDAQPTWVDSDVPGTFTCAP
jgi:Concanavalin A-like lectin/glucanases superfamily